MKEGRMKEGRMEDGRTEEEEEVVEGIVVRILGENSTSSLVFDVVFVFSIIKNSESFMILYT